MDQNKCEQNNPKNLDQNIRVIQNSPKKWIKITITRLGLPYKKNLEFFKDPHNQKTVYTTLKYTSRTFLINYSPHLCIGLILSTNAVFSGYTCTF